MRKALWSARTCPRFGEEAACCRGRGGSREAKGLRLPPPPPPRGQVRSRRKARTSPRTPKRAARAKKAVSFAPRSPRDQAPAWSCHGLGSFASLGRLGMERSQSIHADEAELRRQVRSQAGAWERGAALACVPSRRRRHGTPLRMTRHAPPGEGPLRSPARAEAGASARGRTSSNTATLKQAPDCGRRMSGCINNPNRHGMCHPMCPRSSDRKCWCWRSKSSNS